MFQIAATITRFVREHQPNIVSCSFHDFHGVEWTFEDKDAMFTTEYMDERSDYPRPGIIGCEIVERGTDWAGNEFVEVDTELPWHLESTTGETRFRVRPDQLTEYDS